ncbi:MAG: response regulator [Planctomycetes bacterium]|nr:response regulator [Planctomycetota bacterium]
MGPEIEGDGRYREIFNGMLSGYALHEIICDERDHPVDYRFLEVNTAFERITGLKAERVMGRTVLEVLPDIEPYWIVNYGRVALTGETLHFENYSGDLDRYFEVTAFRPAPRQFACSFVDITDRKRMEEKLRASETRLRAVVENHPDIISVFDSSHCLEALHDPLKETSGQAAAHVDAMAHLGPEDRLAVRKEIDRETRAIGPLDSLRWYETLIFRFGEDSAAQRVLLTTRDISERKQMANCRELVVKVLGILNRTSEFQESLRQVIFAVKRVLECDAAGIRLRSGDNSLYGFQEGFTCKFIHAEHLSLIRDDQGAAPPHPDLLFDMKSLCGIVLTSEAEASGFQFTKGGSLWINDTRSLLQRWQDDNLQPHECNRCVLEDYASLARVPILAKDEVVGLLQLNVRTGGHFSLQVIEVLEGIAIHIGEALMRKQTEDRLRDALSQAQAATRAKSQFLANMSHEIRTPMNGILGVAQILSLAPLDANHRSYVEILERSGQNMLAVINDILDITRIEAGKIELSCSPMSVPRLLKGVLAPLAKLAENKSLEFSVTSSPEIPESLLGDEIRLGQILTNLTSNAIKFTQAGRISVRCELMEKIADHAHLRFTVSDTGIGIPADKLDCIFDPFFQVDSSSTRKHGGTGLGLAISKNLSELMGGKLSIDSTLGKGTNGTLWLTLPLTAVQEDGESKGPIEPQQKPRGHVLIVEDDDSCAALLEVFITKVGLSSDLACEGQMAIACLKNRRYDLVLMDCQMPVLNGYDTTRAIRQGEAGEASRAIPIIAQTAHAMKGDRERCLESGMNDFLSKPIRTTDLLAMLNKWLKPVGTP